MRLKPKLSWNIITVDGAFENVLTTCMRNGTLVFLWREWTWWQAKMGWIFDTLTWCPQALGGLCSCMLGVKPDNFSDSACTLPSVNNLNEHFLETRGFFACGLRWALRKRTAEFWFDSSLTWGRKRLSRVMPGSNLTASHRAVALHRHTRQSATEWSRQGLVYQW